MIVKINNKLILFEMDKYNNSSELYLSLWKNMYNIELNKESLNVKNLGEFINNKKIFI